MVEVDVEDGLRYPFRGENALAVHAVGGGVPVVLAVALVPVWLAAVLFEPARVLFPLVVGLQLAVGVFWAGYFVRVVRRTVDGADELPPLDDWRALARDGLWGVLFGVAYTVPGVVLNLLVYAAIVASVFGVDAVGETGPQAGLAAGLLTVVVTLFGTLVVLLYFAVAAYLLPASLVVFAAEGDVRAAFAPGRLRPLLTSGEYVVPWLVVAGGVFAVYLLVGFLTTILVGYLLVPLQPLAFFYLALAGAHMFGRAYVRATGAPGGRRPEDV